MTTLVEQKHLENQILDEHIDKGIDNLVDSTAIIRNNAKEIGSEIKDQVEMVKDMNEQIDKTDNKINTATERLERYEKITAGNYTSWIIMILLIIAIIVVLVAF